MILYPLHEVSKRRVEGVIKFEGSSHRPIEGFIETEGDESLVADPNAFLLAAFLPAWISGERRIEVHDAICPQLLAHLTVIVRTMQNWFDDFPELPIVECNTSYRTPQDGAGLFLSGGVDSLAMTRMLTNTLPEGHPDRPTVAALIDYQNISGILREETEARFAQRKTICNSICEDVGLELILLRTNLRSLNQSMQFWIKRYHGMFLAAMAHALSSRCRLFYIASTYDAANLAPWGSHPLVDPYCTSQHMRLVHHGLELSRLGKVRQIADWQVALDRMNVCTSGKSGGHNCGRCEKCVRTKLHLLVEDRLGDSGAFAEGDMSSDDISRTNIVSDYSRACYIETIPELRAMGRHDLADAIEMADKKYSRRQRSKTPVGKVLNLGASLMRRGSRLIGKDGNSPS